MNTPPIQWSNNEKGIEFIPFEGKEKAIVKEIILPKRECVMDDEDAFYNDKVEVMEKYINMMLKMVKETHDINISIMELDSVIQHVSKDL